MTTINNLTKHDSREFKVGDLVVSKNGCELVSEITYLQGGLAKIKNEKFDHVYSLQDFRHADPEEIKAGHRIDDTTDHLTDIRNHVSPSTMVVDL